MTVRVRQVGRASDPQAEMQLQELTRAVNELGGDVEGVQRTLPDVIEDIEKELDDRIPIPTEPPTIPTNLVAIPAFQMFILKWDRSVSEIVDGYIVSFSTSEDGTSWSEWEEIPLPNISVFTHTGLDFNLYYRYRVLAYNRAGRSLWSNITEAQKPTKVSLSEQIIDEHNWMEIWDRAAAISEEGKFLSDKIEGFIKKHQLEETVQETLDGVYDLGEDFNNAVARLDTNDDQLWYSSIKQVANSIVSEVARIEGALDSPNSNMWYSSIKQTADALSQTVAKLNGSDPVQFSTIQQLANQITSLVADLSVGGETYTKISQNAGRISSIAADVNQNKREISALVQTAIEISGTVANLATNTSSTFQQHANMINQRVVAKDRYGNVINSAQIQVGLVDSQGYILLDASDVFVPGTVHVFDRNPGSAASGQVTIDSDGVEIRGGKLSVVNPSGTVIIDGTSNMFKIVDTGLLAVQPNYINTVMTDTILPSAPAFTFYVNLGDNNVWKPWYSTLSTSRTEGFQGATWRRPSDGRIQFRCTGGTENGQTFYVRYFLYKEAGI